jgi:hypothetical protein
VRIAAAGVDRKPRGRRVSEPLTVQVAISRGGWNVAGGFVRLAWGKRHGDSHQISRTWASSTGEQSGRAKRQIGGRHHPSCRPHREARRATGRIREPRPSSSPAAARVADLNGSHAPVSADVIRRTVAVARRGAGGHAAARRLRHQRGFRAGASNWSKTTFMIGLAATPSRRSVLRLRNIRSPTTSAACAIWPSR